MFRISGGSMRAASNAVSHSFRRYVNRSSYRVNGHIRTASKLYAPQRFYAKAKKKDATNSVSSEHIALLLAAGSGDVDTMKEHLKSKKCDVTLQDYDGRTVLHVASARGHIEVVATLLEDGRADVSALDHRQRSPLEDAIEGGNADVVALLREHGAKLHPKDEIVAKTCVNAASNHDIERMKLLIAGGVDINSTNKKGESALHEACRTGDTEIAKLLIHNGADLHLVNQDGCTPLDVATQNQKHGVVERLKQEGAKQSSDTYLWMGKTLRSAAATGNLELVKSILEDGIDINDMGIDRRTALHLAGQSGHSDVVKYLIDAGANVNALDRLHRTPLDDARESEHPDILTLLRKKGGKRGHVSTVVVDSSGVMDLTTVAATGDVVAAKKLLKDGSEVNLADYDRRTPLHLAAAEGHPEMVRLLLEHGADANAVDRFGNRPLGDAARGLTQGHAQAEEVLQAAGAKDDPETFHQRNAGNFSETITYLQRMLLRRGRWKHSLCLITNDSSEETLTVFYENSVASPYSHEAKIKKDDGSVIGSVWSTGVPQWVEDLTASEEDVLGGGYTQNLVSIGMKSAVVVPVTTSNNVVAVFVFGDTEVRAKESELLSASAQVAAGMFTTNVALRKTRPPRMLDATTVDKARATFNEMDENKDGMLDVDEVMSALLKYDKTLSVENIQQFMQMGSESGDIKEALDFEAFKDVLHKLESSSGLSSGAMQAMKKIFYLNPTIEAERADIMSEVFAQLLRNKVFGANLLYEEIDWFFNHLLFNPHYFYRFKTEEIASHIQLFIAAKKLAHAQGRPGDIWLEADTELGKLYIVPSKYESIDRVEHIIDKEIASLAPNETYSLCSFQSKGNATPDSDQRLDLYIFERARFMVPQDQVEEVPVGEELDIFKLATASFVADKSDLVIERYQDVLREGVGRLSPTMRTKIYKTRDADESMRDKAHLLLCFRADLSYLSTISEILENHDLQSTRKFVETFANGMVVYSIYLNGVPDMEKCLQSVTHELSVLHCLPRHKILTPMFLDKTYTAEEYAYANAVMRAIYYFMQSKSDEFEVLAKAFENDSLNMGRLANLHTKLRTAAVPPNRIAETLQSNVEIVKLLFRDFEQLGTDSNSSPTHNQALAALIRKNAESDIDRDILLQMLEFNACMLKTNFFSHSKSSLSFRLSGSMASGHIEEPYGIFFVVGPDFQGFHVRFRDIARGGVRLIPYRTSQAYHKNAETQFSETYNLALTQNKKNKDIPEFGSKGTVLLYPHAPATETGMRLTFQRYVAGLLDLMVPKQDGSVVDHYGKEELLFLGPDEGTADWMEWAALYAKKRNYPFWKAFTTGKPLSMGGIPHDRFAMTTRSVHRFKLGCLRKAGLMESECTKVMTGGPDGDLGSNEILISKDKTIAIIDGSGVLFDPHGLDREALTELAHKRQTIKEFPVSKLGNGGFCVLVTDKDVKLPNGGMMESGVAFRNTFHLNPLCRADLFVPCGGRPSSINVSNVHEMIDEDGVPHFPIIVEGANLFCTSEARQVLEEHGVVLYKDASANKGGVTSSSLEVLAALALTDAEFKEHMSVVDEDNVLAALALTDADFKEHMSVVDEDKVPEFYTAYVKEIQTRIEENADLEFECVWKEHERTQEARHIVTDHISDKINVLNDFITNSTLFDTSTVRIQVLEKAIPKTLQDLVGLDSVVERVPDNYLKALFSSYVASRYIYQYGTNAPELAFFEFMKNHIGAK